MLELTFDLPRDRIAEFAQKTYWYHAIGLPNGITTRGRYDYEPFLDRYHFPASLAGQSCLDVGASDGFFSFEMERRGAASVLAIDTNKFDSTPAIDPSRNAVETYRAKYKRVYANHPEFRDVYERLGVPVGHQFLAAKALMGSGVEYKVHSVYDLDALGRTFDFVFCGNLIEHLKDPIKATEQLAIATKGLCVVALSNAKPHRQTLAARLAQHWLPKLGVPMLDPATSMAYVGNVSGGAFYYFYPETFRQMLLAAGFRSVEIASQFTYKSDRNNIFHVIYLCRP